MGLYLTSEDIRRYEAASRALLSPLTYATVDDWRRDVNAAVRELLRGDQVVFMLPKGERLFFSEEAPDLAAGVEQYVTDYSADGIRLSDAVVDFWQDLRRKEHVNVFSWAANAQMIGRYGHAMKDSDMVSGVLEAYGVHDFVGAFTTTPLGEVLLWTLFDETEKVRFGESSLALLRTLLPSLNAGLDALVRLDAQRASLDLLADAVIVFDPDGRELHRNAALTRLCASDPEYPALLDGVRRFASTLHPFAFRPGRPGANTSAGAAGTKTAAANILVPPGRRSWTTRTSSYTFSGTLLPPGSFGTEPSTMVTVTKDAGVTLPATEVLQKRFGLTAREAEVALHIAEGRSNAEIAELLYLSPHTARRHTANIFDKLGVNSRKGLALLFLRD